jgi:hypothetical protein
MDACCTKLMLLSEAIPQMLLSEAHDLLTCVSHKWTATIPSGLWTSENSTFNIHSPSKCMDFRHVSSWIGRLRFTSGLDPESMDLRRVSPGSDGPDSLQTLGFDNINSQLKPKFFYLKFAICRHASLWIWRSRFTPNFRFWKFQFSTEIFEMIFPEASDLLTCNPPGDQRPESISALRLFLFLCAHRG